jgi:hypothetical protein
MRLEISYVILFFAVIPALWALALFLTEYWEREQRKSKRPGPPTGPSDTGPD